MEERLTSTKEKPLQWDQIVKECPFNHFYNEFTENGGTKISFMKTECSDMGFKVHVLKLSSVPYSKSTYQALRISKF